MAAAFAVSAASASAATINVDPTGTDSATCGLLATPCETVQQGVIRALAGDTVQIAAGVYQEQVDVSKSISLVGAGSGQTTILSPAGATLIESPGLDDSYPVVFANGANVAISDLRVDGNGQSFSDGSCAKSQEGIAYLNAGGSIENVEVRGTRTSDPTLFGCQGGDGIYAVIDDATDRSLSVTDSDVEDFQKNGITANQNGSGVYTVEIADNTVTGSGLKPIAQNGIQVAGSSATVENNTVTALKCADGTSSCGPDPVDDTQASGILVIEAGPDTSVSDNRISNNDSGIQEYDTSNPLIVEDNEFNDNRFEGIYTADAPMTASGNVISGGNVGVAAVSYDFPGFVSTPELNLRGNTITGADDQAVLVTRSPSSATPPTVTVAFNRIVGNAAGVVNTGGGSVNAENNWWGCNAGPNQAGCDTTTGTVDFDPWLVLGLTASPNSILTGGATSQLTASLRTNSAGQAAGSEFPDATPVAFATSLGAVDGSGITVSGRALSTLTSGATAGTANVSATLDNQTVTSPVTIAQPTTTVPGPTTPTDPTTPTGPTTPTDPTTPTVPGPSACTNAINGKKKSDKLVGTDAGDVIKGKRGNDRIDGGAGRDCLSGGAGNDKIKARDGEADQINCGSGKDRVKADSLDVIKANCEKVKVSG